MEITNKSLDSYSALNESGLNFIRVPKDLVRSSIKTYLLLPVPFVLFGSAVGEGVERGSYFLILLAVAAIVNSALSLAYYARVIRVAYIDEAPEVPARLGLSIPARAVLGAALVLTVVIGLWPQPVLDLSRAAATDLLAAAGP